MFLVFNEKLRVSNLSINLVPYWYYIKLILQAVYLIFVEKKMNILEEREPSS
jgi:hypothetical protein